MFTIVIVNMARNGDNPTYMLITSQLFNFLIFVWILKRDNDSYAHIKSIYDSR